MAVILATFDLLAEGEANVCSADEVGHYFADRSPYQLVFIKYVTAVKWSIGHSLNVGREVALILKGIIAIKDAPPFLSAYSK